jgi:predicted nucleic acid-binding Zn ribbon protein
MNKCKNCLADIPNERKFCDSSCAATYNNKLYPKRTYGRTKPKCLYCGKEINARYDQKFCSNKCQGESRRNELFEKVRLEKFDELGNKASIDRTTKKYLIKVYGDKCMKCGWDDVNHWTGKVPIELNHIDGNPENHKLNNVELLCPNCHSLSEFTKSRGKGRKWRKTIFTK